MDNSSKDNVPCLCFYIFGFRFVVFLLSEIKKYMKKRKQGVTGNDVKPRWELDYELLENEGLFGEYLEMGKPRREINFANVFQHCLKYNYFLLNENFFPVTFSRNFGLNIDPWIWNALKNIHIPADF